ncbi:hypothetical protein EON67_02150, partial [archaeon]
MVDDEARALTRGVHGGQRGMRWDAAQFWRAYTTAPTAVVYALLRAGVRSRSLYALVGEARILYPRTSAFFLAPSAASARGAHTPYLTACTNACCTTRFNWFHSVQFLGRLWKVWIPFFRPVPPPRPP